MFTPIHEHIAVVCLYARGKCTPKKFLWNKKEYRVDAVTLRTILKDGQKEQTLYACMVQGTLYRILFDQKSQHWTLEEVWTE